MGLYYVVALVVKDVLRARSWSENWDLKPMDHCWRLLTQFEKTQVNLVLVQKGVSLYYVVDFSASIVEG